MLDIGIIILFIFGILFGIFSIIFLSKISLPWMTLPIFLSFIVLAFAPYLIALTPLVFIFFGFFILLVFAFFIFINISGTMLSLNLN